MGVTWRTAGFAPVGVIRPTTAPAAPVGEPLVLGCSTTGASRSAGRAVGGGPPASAPWVCSSQSFTCSSPGESATALRNSGSAER